MRTTMLKHKYGALTGCTQEALEFFQELIDVLEAMDRQIQDILRYASAAERQ